MATPRHANLSVSAPVEWSNGEPFTGYVWLGLTLPTGYTSPAVRFTTRTQPIPRFTKVHVVSGVVDQNAQVLWNADITPPGTTYRTYFFDPQNVLIAPGSGSATAFSVATSTHVLTVPTLTPPAISSIPVPET